MSLKHLAPLWLLLGAGPVLADEASLPKVDESALRYYASHNEMDYYQAELKRLRALYPSWTPPADAAAMVEEDNPEEPLWALFAKGDLEGLEKAAAALKAERPGWTMSDDLARKLAVGKARTALLAASDAGNHPEVLRIAAAEAGLGGCADPEADWRIAAAQAHGDARDAAFGRYSALVTGCDDLAVRRATIEKALAELGPAAARPLLALGRQADDFAGLRPAFTRADITARLKDPAAPEPDPADLKTFAAAALDASAADAQLIGWYRRSLGDHAAALEAFEAASTLLGGDPKAEGRAKVVEGIVLSLAGTGDGEAAATMAHDNRALSPDLQQAYVELAAASFEGAPRPRLPDDRLADYAAAVLDLRSAAGAEAIGWYAYDFGQWRTAAQWFDSALAWEPAEGAARGAALAAAAQRQMPEVESLLAHWEPQFPGMAEDIRRMLREGSRQGSSKPSRKPGASRGDALAARFDRRDYAGCVELARKLGRLQPRQQELLGWCLLKLDRPSEAAASFALAAGAAADAKARQDALYGRSLALFAAGDTRGAAAAAGSAPMSGKRRAEIGVAVLADEAIAAFGREDWRDVLSLLDERRRFAAETMDLSMMRGWANYHLGGTGEAERIFASLDRTVSTAETRHALAKLRDGRKRSN